MERERARVTQRILDLTLEIISLLTGEDCTVMRKSGEPLAPILESPRHPLVTEGKNKRILEVTNQIVELLTGEDWTYIDGDKDVKEEAMMEDQLPLTSADGSRKRKRNPPQRCPRNPLQEGHRKLCRNKNKAAADHKAGGKAISQEEALASENRQSVLKFGVRVSVKEEETTGEISADGSSKKDLGPLHSRDSTKEDHCLQEESLSQLNAKYREPEKVYSSAEGESEDQEDPLVPELRGAKGTQTNVKVKEEPEDAYLWTIQECNEKGSSSEIGKDGRYRQYKRGAGDEATNSPAESPITRVKHVRDLIKDATADEDMFFITPHISHHTAIREKARAHLPEAPERELISHPSGPTPERPFECTVCGKCFAEKAHLGSHERAHTNERPYSCSVCGRCFGDKSHLAAHEITHAAEKPYSCSICGKSYAEKSHLVSHERTHSTEKPHQCPVCWRCFAERSHLVNHERSHSSERRYGCSICGKTFSEKGHLANHEKSHATERSFFCFDCGKYFSQRGHYNRHQRTHTEAKPFACSECGKSFSQKEYLLKHKRFHTGEKPYACVECGKCFTDRYDLGKHERIHTGDRPYTCAWCRKGFAQKSNLVRHERVHANPPFVSVPAAGSSPLSNTGAQQEPS